MKEKMINNIKKIVLEEFRFWEVVILMFLTAVTGIIFGRFISNKNIIFSSSNSSNSALQDFISNYNYIVDNYYGDINEKEVLDKALQKVIEELDDPYAAYMDETDSENLNIELNGSYHGIGIEVAMLASTKQFIVVSVFKDSPADKAGLHAGDIILKYNDELLQDISTSDFSEKIKNSISEFNLTILRNDEELVLSISPNTVVINSVESMMYDNNIGYIYISIFANNTYDQVKDALTNLTNSEMKSLIIDVRNNTGGYLTSVENILSLFLDYSNVIYQLEDKAGVTKFYSKGKNTIDYEVVVLTNEVTASAAEILTAALKDNINAISVGKKTFGKGSAQKLHELSDGTQYKFTTQKWLTPSGKSIDGVGVDVDYDVAINQDYHKNPTFENDNQLQYAIDLLNK